VPVRVERGATARLWLTTPPIEFGPLFDRDTCASALGLPESDLAPSPPQLVSAGNPNVYVALRDPQASTVRGSIWKACAVCTAASKRGLRLRLRRDGNGRVFAHVRPEHGVVEDAATGSATGPLAAYMMRYGLTGTQDGAAFVSEQGTKMGRRSFLHVLVHGENGSEGIEVGGSVVPFAQGTLNVP